MRRAISSMTQRGSRCLQSAASALALLLAATLAGADVLAGPSAEILSCSVTGDTETGERVLHLVVAPPSRRDAYDLWALDTKHQVGHVVRTGVGIGTIEVTYGASREPERRDLVFLQVGNSDSLSHVAYWERAGVYRHLNFLRIDTWSPDREIEVFETLESQPLLAGTCRPASSHEQ